MNNSEFRWESGLVHSLTRPPTKIFPFQKNGIIFSKVSYNIAEIPQVLFCPGLFEIIYIGSLE